jgi:hypothetical protein
MVLIKCKITQLSMDVRRLIGFIGFKLSVIINLIIEEIVLKFVIIDSTK